MSELREGFEAWLNTKFISLDGGLNEWTGQFDYVYPHVQSMWVAWQGCATYLDSRHAEFVRTIRARAAATLPPASNSGMAPARNPTLIKIIALCDAELEQSNG